MCGRYTLSSQRLTTIEARLGQSFPELQARYNITPSQLVPAVRWANGRYELASLKWGLLPAWAKEAKFSYSTINARAETVDAKPAFRTAFRRQRCLIPADGFYEWVEIAGRKQPYYIQLKGHEVFAFAGLWEHWSGPEGEAIESCTIIVTDANQAIRPIHDRMRVILPPASYSEWLAPDTRMDVLKQLLKPCDSEAVELYPVSQKVNSPRNDGPDLIERVDGA
jgi:putative SOS response-associated peptidase YedK